MTNNFGMIGATVLPERRPCDFIRFGWYTLGVVRIFCYLGGFFSGDGGCKHGTIARALTNPNFATFSPGFLLPLIHCEVTKYVSLASVIIQVSFHLLSLKSNSVLNFVCINSNWRTAFNNFSSICFDDVLKICSVQTNRCAI